MENQEAEYIWSKYHDLFGENQSSPIAKDELSASDKKLVEKLRRMTWEEYRNFCRIRQSRLTERKGLPRDMMNAEYAKLADLEDIEEDLGVNLEKLLTAKTAYCIVETESKGETVIKREIFAISPQRKEIWLGSSWSFTAYRFKDYGRTWSFVKKELKL